MASFKHNILQALWEIACVASGIGIWPRHIERRLLSTSSIELTVPHIDQEIRIVQFSDLHLCPHQSDRFLAKLSRRINRLEPHIIVFTGDFLCYGQVGDEDRLSKFLNTLRASHGAFAILGNHDYSCYLSVNRDGDYDAIKPNGTALAGAVSRLIKGHRLTGKITEAAKTVSPHPRLVEILKATPFQFLDNHTAQVLVEDSALNICGLGDYWAGRCQPEKAFREWDERYSGIVLSHNPDTFPLLRKYPGSIVLSGHTHGGQVNVPIICKRAFALENPAYKRGLKKEGNRLLYVNRGVGSTFPARWFSVPELLLLKLKREVQ